MSDALLLKAMEAIAPYTQAFAITPDPNTDLPIPTRAIRCSVAGSLVVNTVGGDKAVTVNFLAGETRALRVLRVISQSTSTIIEGMT